VPQTSNRYNGKNVLTCNKSSTDYSSKEKDYKKKYENKKRKLRECRIELEKLSNEIDILKSNEKIKSDSYQNINIQFEREREMIDLIKKYENEVRKNKSEHYSRR
jgi:hypothetical protein